MSYTILDPHPSPGYMAALRLWQGRTAMTAGDRMDAAVAAAEVDEAVREEIRFRETGEQNPVFVGGRWLVVKGGQWVEVSAPAGVEQEVRVRVA